MATPFHTSAPFWAPLTTAGTDIALDTHVHLYPGADLAAALNAGLDNLTAAARRSGYEPRAFGLLLTETARDHAFDAIASGALRVRGWSVQRYPQDEAALRLTREHDGGDLLLLAGSQIVTAERIEVLALASRKRLVDGQPLRRVLDTLAEEEFPAVLPWGVGKWLGPRGRLIGEVLGEARGRGIALGDNAGRPPFWPRPGLFLRAEKAKMPVLAGTDPLPTAGAERGIGRYGCVLGVGVPDFLSSAQPAAEIRQRLRCLRGALPVIGCRRDLRSVAAEQIALRRGARV